MLLAWVAGARIRAVKRIKIGVLGYEGVTALDLVGPAEAFAVARVDGGDGTLRPAYEVVILGVTAKPFTAESGMVFKPHRGLDGKVDVDTLIVPGGCGLRNPRINARVTSWLRANASRFRRVASVCTGIYGLAATGLLDGRRATTHWRFVRDVAERFPALTFDPNALFIKDGPFYTSAGVTAGIDLALALIEEDLRRGGGAGGGAGAGRLPEAARAARSSSPSRCSSRSSQPTSSPSSPRWIRGHLRHDLSVEALAERACLCPRQFTRRFTRALPTHPGRVRRRPPTRRSAETTLPARDDDRRVATSVGFRSADAFRRAFERRFGISPTNYRRQFSRKRV